MAVKGGVSGVAAKGGVGDVATEDGVAAPTLVWLPSLPVMRLFNASTICANLSTICFPVASFSSCSFNLSSSCHLVTQILHT